MNKSRIEQLQRLVDSAIGNDRNEWYLDLAEDLLKESQQSNWIKCSEQMPPIDKPVLIYWFGSVRYSYLTEICAYGDLKPKPYDQLAWFDREDCCGDRYYEFKEVTHWMPLPSPPKDEK